MAHLARLAPRIGALSPRVTLRPKEAEGFYKSPEWRRFVQSIKARRGNFCEDCGSNHRVIGDHIVERKDGGADFDEQNIRLRCIRCHNSKTAQARKARALGMAMTDKAGG